MPQDLFQIALEHHRAGRLRQAEAGYRALLEASPDDADAAHWLGVLLFQAGGTDQALPLLERAAALRPNDAAFHHNLGQALLTAGRAGDAIGAFGRASSLAPGHAEAPAALAIALLARAGPGDAGAAAEALRQAQAAGLDSPESHHDLGVALLAAGRPDEAIAAFRMALQRRPDYASALHRMASAWRAKGEPREVRKCLLKALEAEPGLARAWFDLATLDADAGNPGVAAGLFRKAVAAKSDYAEGWLGLGRALGQLGKRDEAAAAFAKAARIVEGRATPAPAGDAGGAGAAPTEPEQAGQASVEELERKLNRQDALDLHFALASLRGVFSPPRLPQAGLKDLFDRYADTFDHALRDQLKYQAPEGIARAVAAAREADPRLAGRAMDVFDLGCGTGLCGLLLRPVAATLCGVDLSPAMVEKARGRGVYDRLETGDLVEALKKAPRSFDLLVAADVFVYVGDLALTFEAAARSLRPGGLLAFSVEAGGGDRFHLTMATRRYTHSEPYLKRMAAIYGFEEVSLTPIALRLDAGKPVPGFVVVLRLPRE